MGISTSAARRVNPRRGEFLRLRAAGLTRAQARARVGADARSARFVMLGHLGRERSAETVRDSLIVTIVALPTSLRTTLTWDQGAEMVEHRAFSTATNLEVYFADPGSPWQRGANENTNGRLRQHFPRGTNLASHSSDDLRAVAQELNERPRKSPDWDTPAERLAALLKAS